MPRKLRHPKSRQVRARLIDFSGPEMLAFIAGWSPEWNRVNAWRWTTYEGLLKDYLTVRDEVLEKFTHKEPFGERVYRFFQTYGAEELRMATSQDIRDDDGR